MGSKKDGNIELLFLLTGDSIPTLSEVLAARKKCDQLGMEYDDQVLMNMIDISTVFDIKRMDEYCLYPVLADYLNAEIIAGPSNPDLITKCGIPVEAKTGTFDKSALKQLQKYMVALGQSKGIACGEELSVTLPEGIEFVRISYQKKAGKYVICQ